MDNEEILRIGGECPRANCIEVAGHAGPCSGDMVRGLPALQHQLHEVQGELLVAKRNADSWQETAQQAQEERDRWKQQAQEERRLQIRSGRLRSKYRAGWDAAIERAEAAEALVAAYRKADMKLALDTHNAAAMEINEDTLEHPAEAQAEREDDD